jgi:nitrogen regulatory protein PII
MKEAMKKLDPIVKGNQLQAIQELLDQTEVSGYTIILNISGKWHHGLHQGKLMFNELDTLDWSSSSSRKIRSRHSSPESPLV